MNTADFFSIILASCGATALYMGLNVLRKFYRDYKGNFVLGLMCLASAIWCYGFAILFLTDNVKTAYWGRTLGMIGVFTYLIFAQELVGIIVTIPKKMYLYFCIFAHFGVLIYLPTVSPSAAKFYVGKYGMTYTFNPGVVNNIYTIFSILYGINMLVSILYIVKNGENTRSRVAGKKMLVAIIIIFSGMVLDTIFPMFGYGAVPGSSITQFIGLVVMYYSVADYNRTRLTVMNMSSYVYENVSEPVMVFNPAGIMELSNKAAGNVFGGFFEKCGKDNILLWNLFSLKSNHFVFEGESRVDDNFSLEGNIPVQIQTNRITDDYNDTTGFILIIKDMTEIRNAMDALVEAKRQADANSHAKSAFLANVSHEIRTPLNAIVGFSELLLKDALPAKAVEQVEDIRSSSYNLLAIINDVLDISKIESGRMELIEDSYNVSTLIRDSFLITEALAKKKGLELSMAIDENIPSVMYGDIVRLRGVLVNVITNAIKYTREGGVRFESILVDVEKETAFLEFRIIDTGIGIRKEDIDKIFDTFTQVDQKKLKGVEGTGLGLAIVKGFVALMGGTIKVESEYGIGSTFIISIPQRIVDRTPVGKLTIGKSNKEIKSAIGDKKFTGVKVLAVDDNKINLRLIQKALEKYEMQVEVCDNAETAVELCKANEYKIILMDQMMPVVDGVTAMKRIRRIAPYYAKGGSSSIIVLTANAVYGAREELINEGFDAYLAKPIEFDKMEALFSDIIHS